MERVINAAVKRKEAAWKEMFAASDERQKKMYGSVRKGKVKRCIIQSKKKVIEQFGRKMDEDVNGNRKLFWKEVSNAKGGKVQNCSRKKDENERLVLRDNEVRKIWKE